MKNYSRTKGAASRTTYRTPSRFIMRATLERNCKVHPQLNLQKKKQAGEESWFLTNKNN